MVRSLQLVRRWSRSADEAVQAATDGAVRVLTEADTPALQALIAQDPVTNCFADSILRTGRTAGPSRAGSTLFLGLDAPPTPTTSGPSGAAASPGGALVAACWVGANVVPVQTAHEQGAQFGSALVALHRRFASVYGPQDGVLGVWSQLRSGLQQSRDVRTDQPLMVRRREVPEDLRHRIPEPHPHVRPARPEEFGAVLPAAAGMFEEELGFSPLVNGAAAYRDRVRQGIERGHSLVLTGADGQVRFKADFGVVTPDCVQIQGVWVHPRERGRGLAAPCMAAVVQHALDLAPTVSLYVNAYNLPARRTYERVGFTTAAPFATVLF